MEDPAAAGPRHPGDSLIEIIAGAGPAATAASLVVRVAPYAAAPAVREARVGIAIADPALAPAVREARVGIAIADPALAQAVSTAVTAAIAAAVAETFACAAAIAQPTTAAARTTADACLEVAGARTMRVGSRAGLARRAGDVAGAIAIVPVTARNARHLVELVDQLRAAGAAGVQLVWDGRAPPRDRAERHVFAVLERARSMPAGAPVVVSTGESVAAALHLLIAHRSGTLRKDEPR
jgi:hypothetical protein